MAHRGAPAGNRNGAHDKPWTKALERAILQYEAKGIKAGEAIRKLADRVVRDALAGDAVATREIAERLDGKPVQPVAGTIDTNLTVQVVRFGSNPVTK
jgi:uncharacterized protein YoaH (UPF0181 family)